MNTPTPQRLTPQELTEQLATLPNWQLDRQCSSITRTVVLTDFMQAFAYMTHIAIAAEKKNHHPEWSNVYNTLTITWTTHDAGGLTPLDIAMATLCDQALSA